MVIIVDLISREEAKQNGFPTYFTGIPCKRGHLSERYVSNATCKECAYSTMTNWRKNPKNIEHYNEYHSHYNGRKRLAIKRATPYWADKNAIRRIYDEKVRLEKVMNMPLEVVHTIPLKGRIVCGLHVDYNLSLVSRSLSRLQGNRFNSKKESKMLMKWLKEQGLAPLCN